MTMAEDITTLNVALARLLQWFHLKQNRKIYERVNAAYRAGTRFTRSSPLWFVTFKPSRPSATTKKPAPGQIKSLTESALRLAQKPGMIGLLRAEMGG